MALKNVIRKTAISCLTRGFALFRKPKSVLFSSFNGKSYSDNPRAISEALHKLDPDAEIVWAFLKPAQKKSIVPEYVRMVNRSDGFAYYRELAAAKVVVSNYSFIEPKGKGQRFLQTWHGDRAFKKILYDANANRKQELSESIDGFCDLALAGSEYGVSQYRTGFRYKGEVLTVGTPRDDILIHPEAQRIETIRQKLGIQAETKILLYAPTLRWVHIHGQGDQEIQDLDIKRTIQVLEEKDGSQWVCLMRAHPVMSGLFGFETNEKILDVSGFEDMADLLLVADVLITDYSSCAGDFALTHRPIILYQSDRREYREKDRDFYFEMEDSPYMIAENQQELEDWISRLDEETVRKNCDEILRFYKTTESGKAADAAAGRIVEWLNED